MKIEPTRRPHAVMDLVSRRAKGLKIERLLDLESRSQPMRILDIGTGNGGIAHYFASHDTLKCEVTSVDVVDQREIREGYEFIVLDGTLLPFEDDCFDVVISNHVIEHVGDRTNQLHHLSEVRRTLSPAGVGYLAVPNRWMIVEPHYRLHFLSWLPRPLRSPYLRLMRKDSVYYDCEPLSVPEIEFLLSKAGFYFKHLHLESIHQTYAIEGAKRSTRWLFSLPSPALMLLRRVTPTLIYRLERGARQVCGARRSTDSSSPF